jgi:hypothetical protein
LSDDEDEDYTGYPSDNSTDYDEAFAVAATNVDDPTSDNTPPATAVANVDSPSSGCVALSPDSHTTTDIPDEEEGPNPGAYLECIVCGTLFDLTPRKKGQPWHVVFIGRTVSVFRSL